MGFARKLGFCLKPTGPFSKLFPVKSDPMKGCIHLGALYNEL